ncbi:MAG TPA: uracil-DNA glycosylase family protein [Sphingomicrobium sp.]|nr:uracil-DNA glycosylase family protein [Sphingomicrobium sp.]
MGGELGSIGEAEARSALAWWLQAGVDAVLQEEPRNWLKPSPPKRPASEPAAPPNITQPSHETLAQLQDWLATSAHLPLASATARRILPCGPENAEIMLLSDSPALEDYAAGQPIGGDAWVLAQRMLAAIGLSAKQAYCASLSPIHSPGARLAGREREDFAEIARRHIRLAAPKRLLLFGDGPSLALLGKPVARARGHIHKVEGVRTVATFHPRHLIKRTLDKSLAWQDLLLLMEDES